MTDLPGQPATYETRLQEIPGEFVDTKLLAEEVRKDLKPGDVRYARTGPGVKMPQSITIEDSILLVSAQWGEPAGNGQREIHTLFLTDLGPTASIQCLEDVIRQIREIIADRSSKN